jgi:hypothetical protein
MLTLATITGDETLRRKGFVVIPSLLPEVDIYILEGEMRRLLALPSANAEYHAVRAPDGSPMVVNGLDRSSDLMFDFARRPDMIAAATTILGMECIPLHVEFFAKPPNTSYRTPAHQDHIFYHNHFDVLAVAFWVALDDVDASNGGLEYASFVPERLLEHSPSSSIDFDSELIDTSMFSFEPVSLRRGDCVVHHSLAIHRSAANKSPRARRAIAFNYRASPYRHWLNRRLDDSLFNQYRRL